MAETRMTVRSHGGRVLAVEVNGKRVPHPISVSFSADANDEWIKGHITFGVDAVDLIATAEALATPQIDAQEAGTESHH